MNNRQKAKRFKRLYEENLKKPIPKIFIEHENFLQHYRSAYVYDERLSYYAWFEKDDVREDAIAEDLAKKFIPEIKKHVVKDIDYDTCEERYVLDIWMMKMEAKDDK